MRLPLVTLYIVNFNTEHFLEEAIDSAVNQTYKNLEIIIIDNSPNLKSARVVQKPRSKPIKYVENSQTSLVSASNLALSMASGEWIVRLDADDYLHLDAIELLMNEAQTDQSINLVYGNYSNVDKNGSIYRHVETSRYNAANGLKDQYPHGACTMFKAKQLKDLGGYNPNLKMQDGFDLWLKMTSISGTRVAHVNATIFYYRFHDKNLSKAGEDALLRARHQILAEFNTKKETHINAIGVIATLGRFAPFPLNQLTINNCKVYETVIEHLLASKTVSNVVFTTPDEILAQEVEEKYRNLVHIHLRDSYTLIEPDTGLQKTVFNCLNESGLPLDNRNVIIANPKCPLFTPIHYDSAVLTKNHYNTDYVIPVVKTLSNHYRKYNKGLQALGNNSFVINTFFESKELFRQVRGLIVTDVKQLSEKKYLLDGKIGYIIVDEKYDSVIEDQVSYEKVNFYKSMEN